MNEVSEQDGAPLALAAAGDGVAAILLADHQTTGGYPKIATVLDCDLDALVQLRPRQPLRFVAVPPDEAVRAARASAAADRRHLQALGQPRG